MPDITFVVSAFDRPQSLRCCLASLWLQARTNMEIIVTDNSEYGVNLPVVKEFPGTDYLHTKEPSCYHSAERGAQVATGQFLCFPSDDSMYVPIFAKTMLDTAWDKNLDLLLCGLVYNGRWPGEPYHLMDVAPRLNHVDKTNFILKRDKFIGFPDKQPGYCAADGMMIDRLVASGIRHAVIPDVLAVHN